MIIIFNTKPEDWYQVTRSSLMKAGLRSLVTSRGVFRSQATFIQFLRVAFPKMLWDPWRMAWSSLGFSKLHAALEDFFGEKVIPVRDIFADPNINEIKTDYPRDQILLVPTLKLCFIYQGPMFYAKQIIEKVKVLDNEASNPISVLSAKEGYFSFSIPFWWNRERNSLLAEIFRVRPNLFEEDGPLFSLKEVAMNSSAIPNQMLRKNLGLSQSYLKSWYQDPRFNHLFTSDPNLQPKRRKLSTHKKRIPFKDPYKLFTKPQLLLLREAYEEDNYPGRAHCEALAANLGVDLTRVQHWFRYKRAHTKSKIVRQKVVERSLLA